MAALASVSFGTMAMSVHADPLVVDDPVSATQLLVLANAERAAAGIAPLELRTDVYDIAVGQSRRMAAAGDIWHNDDYFTSAVRQRLGAKSLGENVALNKSAEDAHRRLMLSPGHRANLMNPKFTLVGMAVVRSLDGMGYITQDFAEPIAGARLPLPVPVPVPAVTQPALAEQPPAPEPAPAPAPAAPAAAMSATPAPSVHAPAPAPAVTAPPSSAPPAAAPSDSVATATPEPAAQAGVTTTTALEVVSVVTAPISSTAAAPAPALDDAGPGSRSPHLVLAALALAALVLVAGGALRAQRR